MELITGQRKWIVYCSARKHPDYIAEKRPETSAKWHILSSRKLESELYTYFKRLNLTFYRGVEGEGEGLSGKQK